MHRAWVQRSPIGRYQRLETPSVLIVATYSPQLYGSAKMLLRLLQWWPETGLRPILVVSSEGPLARQARVHGAEVEVIPGLDSRRPVWRRLPHYVGVIRALIKVARRGNARMVFVQNRRLLVLTLPATLAAALPRVWQVGLGTHSQTNRLINCLCLAVATTVVIESPHQARLSFGATVARRSSNRIRIIPKGVDLSDTVQDTMLAGQNTDPHGRLRIGTAALISHRKGLDILLRAAMQARDLINTVVIAGEPVTARDVSYQKGLEALCANQADCPPVHFLGWVREVAAFYQSLDLFIMASRNEGVSGAVREAMLVGVPVIATDVGGMRDLIEDRKTGLLVPPDDPAALAEAIRHMACDTSLRLRMAQAAREHVRVRYDPQAFAQNYCRLFMQLLR